MKGVAVCADLMFTSGEGIFTETLKLKLVCVKTRSKILGISLDVITMRAFQEQNRVGLVRWINRTINSNGIVLTCKYLTTEVETIKIN